MKKGVKKIIAGGLLFGIAMILPFAFIIPLIAPFFQEDSVTLRAPGSLEIRIDKPGRYYLWHNYRDVFEGRSYSFSEALPNGLLFSLTEKSSGSAVPMEPDTSLSSASGAQKKSSVGYFEVTQPGLYILSISGTEEQRLFSLEKSMLGKIFLFCGGVILVPLFTLAAAIAAIVLIVLGIIELVHESKTGNQRVGEPSLASAAHKHGV